MSRVLSVEESMGRSILLSPLPRWVLALFVVAFAREAEGQCSGTGRLTFDFVGSTQATVGVPYSALLDVHGGGGGTSLLQSGGLPPGLTAQASPPDIVISGTPTQPGTFRVSLTALDTRSGNCGVFNFTITVAGALIAIAPASLPDGVVGMPYNQKLTATGSGGPYTFAALGALPPGLTLSGDTISGTPTQEGTFPFGISVSGGGSMGRADYSILITATPRPRLEVTMTDGGTPWGVIPYDSEDSGPQIPYTITCFNLGTAPATGVVLHLLLDGTLGCDAANPGRQQAADLPQPDLRPGDRVAISEEFRVCVSAVRSIVGPDPEALTTYQLISQATLSSVETESNTSVAVTPYCNDALCTTFCPLRYLTGYPCPQIRVAPDGLHDLTATLGSPYSQTFQAASGTPPYSFSARDLPDGLSIGSGSGTVSGTATTPGRFEFILGVEDGSSNSCHAEQTYRLDVCSGFPIFSPQSNTPGNSYALPEAIRGGAYRTEIALICGSPPYQVDVPTGLPAGLTFNTFTDVVDLFGRPAQAGDQSFDLRVTDSTGKTSTASYKLHVRQCGLAVGPAHLPPATVGQLYDAALEIQGGEPPYSVVNIEPKCDKDCCDALSHILTLGTFDCKNGDRAKLEFIYRLVFSGGTHLQGYPDTDGRPTFQATVKDSSTTGVPCYGTGTIDLNIHPAPNCPAITLTTQGLPSGQVGIPYAASIAADGGSTPFVYASDDLASNTGFFLDTTGDRTGLIAGTPVAPGTYTFSVIAKDSNFCFGHRTYSIAVDPNPHCQPIYLSPVIWNAANYEPGALPPGKVGVPYTGITLPADRISASGGFRPYRYSIPSMPDGLGLSIDPNNADLAGTPSQPGTYFFTITATDGNSAGACSGSSRYKIVIQPGQLSAQAAAPEKSRDGGLLGLARDALHLLKDSVRAARTVLRDLKLYYQVRDQVLSTTPGGQELTRLYYRHGSEITALLKSDSTLRDQAFATIEAWEPQLRSLVAGFGSDVRVTQAMSDTMTALLTRLKQSGSSSLAADITAQQASINYASWVGLSMDDATKKLDQRPCVASDAALCLNVSRFRVDVSWQDFQGRTGIGHAMPLTGDTGYFWFFSSSNVELVVKALDGRALNGHFWIFYGALSNVAYTLTVTDTTTGAVKTYSNPSGQFGSLGDTSAFVGGSGSALTSPFERSPLARQVTAGCAPTGTSLCLNQSRFQVDVAWRDFQGNTGVGQAVPLTPDTGTFWFFNASNVELIVKVLDGRAINGKFWVFYGALSNVQYTVTVTDTQTGALKTYSNASGVFASTGDTNAF